MFPSAANLSLRSDTNVSNTDWLYNQSYQVPVETLSDDDETQRKSTGLTNNQQSSGVNSDSNVELVEEIVTIKEKSKKKKKKKSRDDDSLSRHRSREKKKKRKRNADRSESPNIDPFGNKVFLEEVGLPPEKAFRKDRRRDPNNLAFDRIYNLLVSSYDKKKCLKSRSVLEMLRKDRQSSTTERYFNSKFHKMINVEPEETDSLPEVTKGETTNLPEIIPISGSAFKMVSNESRSIGDSIKDFHDPVTALYIKAKGPTQQSSSKETVLAPISMDERIIQKKTKEFNGHLRSNPHDIEVWFKFLKWQEDSFIWSPSVTCRKSRETVLAEKKLTIVDKAIESNSKCMRLIMERLKILSFTATPLELEKEWKRLIFLYPNNPLVWKNYFLFLQTHLKYFSIHKITRAFYKFFDIYNSMLEGTFQTHQITPNLEIEILKGLYHFTTCLSHSGYQEKAIAIWQILIEFNLFTPEILTLEQPVTEWTALLEPFWDSGCARFGEPGALGWANVMRNKSLNQGPSQMPIDELEEPLFEQFVSRPQLWLQLELLRERYYWLPVKGPEADQADDTERNVSIEDLTKYLFRFRLDQTKYQLIVFFLKFLGSIDPSDTLDPHFIVDDESILSPVKSLFDLRPVPVYVDYTSFQDQVFIQSIEKMKGKLKQEKKLIMWRLKFLINQVGSTIKYKEVKRIIKDYLKIETYRNDLDLWLQLTQLEMKKGDDYKEVYKIFDTTINLFTGRIDDCRYLLSFTRNYCELILGISRDLYSPNLSYIGPNLKQSENQVVKLITSVTIGQTIETINSPSILKGQKALDTMVQEDDDQQYLDVLFSQLILRLIVDGSTQAFNQCDNLISEYDGGDEENQSNLLGIYTIYLQLLIYDAKRKVKSISKLRTICRSALQSFPDHKPFLLLFTTIETNVSLPIAVDRFFNQLIRSTDSYCLNIWIFKLHFELKRLTIIKGSNEGSSQSCDGIIRRINCLFERCLSFPCNQGIILLWRCFLKFNITHGNAKKAESIVYQALQHCPWSRIIYLDAIDTFPNLMADLVSMLVDKEIRLRAPLEEIDLLLKARCVSLNCDGDDDGQQEKSGQSLADQQQILDIDEESEDSVKNESQPVDHSSNN